MDYHKRFNKCCKILSKSWIEQDKTSKEMKIILHAFQMMKTMNKTQPVEYFIENILPYEQYIHQKDIKFTDIFLSKNPMYNNLYKGLLDTWNKFDSSFQNYVWNQMAILVEYANLYKNTSIIQK